MKRKGSGLSICRHCIVSRDGMPDPNSVESYPNIRRSKVNNEAPVIQGSANRSGTHERHFHLHTASNTIGGFD